MHSDNNRIKFYSPSDLSCGLSLEKAQDILCTFSEDKEETDINKLIEFHNIKLFFDHNIRLKKWTEDDYSFYDNIVSKFDRVIGTFFGKINEENFVPNLENVNFEYAMDYWVLIEKFKVYKRISQETFLQAIQRSDANLANILAQKDIVNYYEQVITDYLTKSPDCAELLISEFLESHDTQHTKLFFPKMLTGQQREQILVDYIHSSQPDPNCLKLIANSQSTIELPLGDKTRYEAKEEYNTFVADFFSKTKGMELVTTVSFSKTQKEAMVCENSYDDNYSLSYSYSSKWIEGNQDYPTLLNNFIYLFEYTDWKCRSKFVSNPADLGVLERLIGVAGNKEYPIGIQFRATHSLFNSQMSVYHHELDRLNIRMETLLN